MSKINPTSERVLLRREDVYRIAGLPKATLSKNLRTGQFPPPTIRVGPIPYWHVDTVDDWVNGRWVPPAGAAYVGTPNEQKAA